MCCPPAAHDGEHHRWKQREVFGLSEKGHRRVLARHDHDVLLDFIQRLTAQLDGKVLSQEHLGRFVDWWSCRRTANLDQLKKTLKQQTWILWHDQSLSSQGWKLKTYPQAGHKEAQLRLWQKQRPPSTDLLLESIQAWEDREVPEQDAALPVPLHARTWPITEEGYLQAMVGDTEMCAFIQQVLLDLGGKMLRKGQLMPFAFWYLRKGYKSHEPWLPNSLLLDKEWRMPKRWHPQDWFLAWAWPKRQLKQEQLVKALEAKYIDPKELQRNWWSWAHVC
eukprot:Skav203095  [mRNA]  locus=scaffold447:216733:221374:+ [translate_table: standard]